MPGDRHAGADAAGMAFTMSAPVLAWMRHRGVGVGDDRR